MKATDKLDICDKVLRIASIVAVVDVTVSAFCLTYRKGAMDAIQDFYALTRGTKYSDVADEYLERSIKNK